MPLYFADGCFISLLKLHILAHHGGAVSWIILVISKYIDTSSNYTWCTQEMAHFATCHETSVLDHLWGVVLPKKKMHIPGALSLSPPLEERMRGEVGGSWTLVRSNHPISIFSQCIPYLAPACQLADCHPPFITYPFTQWTPLLGLLYVHAPPRAIPSCTMHPCCRRDLPQIPYHITI